VFKAPAAVQVGHKMGRRVEVDVLVVMPSSPLTAHLR
jgi:hypothetical protein